ncbi:MAG: signal peptidase II [Lawsonibacter sp.]
MPYALLALALVALDQLVKYLVLEYIPLGGHVPFIPYVLELTYVKNTGAAFSLFAEHTWLLALVSLVMSVVLAVALWKNFFRHPLGKVTLTLLLAGAVGNLIDRAFRHYVVDMFNVLFMNFAVFNVADICVVVGGIAAAVYYLFLAERLEGGKEAENRHGDVDADR